MNVNRVLGAGALVVFSLINATESRADSPLRGWMGMLGLSPQLAVGTPDPGPSPIVSPIPNPSPLPAIKPIRQALMKARIQRYWSKKVDNVWTGGVEEVCSTVSEIDVFDFRANLGNMFEIMKSVKCHTVTSIGTPVDTELSAYVGLTTYDPFGENKLSDIKAFDVLLTTSKADHSNTNLAFQVASSASRDLHTSSYIGYMGQSVVTIGSGCTSPTDGSTTCTPDPQPVAPPEDQFVATVEITDVGK